MKTIRVLLTCIGGRFSVNTIDALRRSLNPKIRIIGVDSDRDTITRNFVDRFYAVPWGVEKIYAGRLLDICKKENVEVLIPCADEEVLSIAQAKEAFERNGVITATDNLETLDLVMDKWKLFSHLRKSGVPTPRFELVSRIGDIGPAARALGYPRNKFVLKPRRSRGARNVWIIGKDKGSTALEDFYDHAKRNNIDRLDYIAMEFLPGPAYDVDVLSRCGQPLLIVPRRRVWRNRLSASSEGCITEKNKPLTELVARISSALKLNYAYDFDCGSFKDSAPAVYEINPRLSGAVAASLGGGVNVPLMLVRMAMGMKLPKFKINFDVSMFPVSKMLFIKKGRII